MHNYTCTCFVIIRIVATFEKFKRATFYFLILFLFLHSSHPFSLHSSHPFSLFLSPLLPAFLSSLLPAFLSPLLPLSLTPSPCIPLIPSPCIPLTPSPSFSVLPVGNSVWEKQFDSPVVGVYCSEGIGNLRKVPITTVGQETLKAITGSSSLAVRMDSNCLDPTDESLKYAAINYYNY